MYINSLLIYPYGENLFKHTHIRDIVTYYSFNIRGIKSYNNVIFNYMNTMKPIVGSFSLAHCFYLSEYSESTRITIFTRTIYILMNIMYYNIYKYIIHVFPSRL